jgi:hypothetical protein
MNDANVQRKQEVDQFLPRACFAALSRVLPSPGRFYPLSELVEWPASGRMIRFWPNHLLSIGTIETSPSSNPVALIALRDPSRPNIWGRTRLDRLDVGVTAINF